MKMIIINICPMCSKYIEQEEPHEYTINKEGKRKVKQFFHTQCFDMINKHGQFQACNDSDK